MYCTFYCKLTKKSFERGGERGKMKKVVRLMWLVMLFGLLLCLAPKTESLEAKSYSVITLSITDKCDDDYLVKYKFYDRTNDQLWPANNEHYETDYYNRKYSHDLRCLTNGKICYGAKTGDLYWGLGFDGNKACDSCCYHCEQGTNEGWDLTCD